MSLISEGAKRPFRKTALTLDSYSDMSGACADGDHSTCRMVHVDVSEFCLCQEHDEHMSYPSQGVNPSMIAKRGAQESWRNYADPDGSYQGWTNPETWHVALWFNNERNHYDATRGFTSESEIENYVKANLSDWVGTLWEEPLDLSVVNWSELIEEIQSK